MHDESTSLTFMEAETRPRSGRAGFLTTGRTSVPNLYFGLCMVAIASAFTLFYVFFKYKIVVFGWILCLAFLATFWLARSARLRLDALVLWPVLAFHAYLWLTTFWSYDPGRTVWWLLLDSLMPAVFLLGLTWAQNVSAWRLSFYFELTALLNMLLGLSFIATSGGLVDTSFGAVRSGMAGTLLAALPFLIWRLRHRPSPYRAVLVIWSVAALLAAGSRSALIILPVALLGSAYITVRTVSRPLSATLIAAVAAVIAIGGAFAVPGVRAGLRAGIERFSPEQQSLDVSANVVAELQELNRGPADIDRRLQVFVALETFLSDPWIGDGYMNTYMKVQNRFNREVSAHGLPVTLLAETGLVGTTLFVLMIWRFFAAIRLAARRAVARFDRGFLLTSSLTMTVMLLFGLFHQVHQSPTFYILLGWGYAVAMVPARERGRRQLAYSGTTGLHVPT